MALIECKNCGNQISDKAARCPKCGSENIRTDSLNKNREANNRSIGFIFLISGLVLVFFSFFYSIREFNTTSYEGYFSSDTFLALIFVVVPIILFTISFFFFKKLIYKIFSILLLGSFILSFLIVKDIYFQSDIAPILDFENEYCNRNSLSNLNNQTLATNGLQFTINENSLHVIGEDGGYS